MTTSQRCSHLLWCLLCALVAIPRHTVCSIIVLTRCTARLSSHLKGGIFTTQPVQWGTDIASLTTQLDVDGQTGSTHCSYTGSTHCSYTGSAHCSDTLHAYQCPARYIATCTLGFNLGAYERHSVATYCNECGSHRACRGSE